MGMKLSDGINILIWEYRRRRELSCGYGIVAIRRD